MIPRLYDFTETAFETNGIGYMIDMISCKVTESRNGDCLLEAEYPTNGTRADQICELRFIYAPYDDSNEPQPFVIYKVARGLKSIKIYAKHVGMITNNLYMHGTMDSAKTVRARFAELKDDDVTVLCGDLSWGSSMEESLQDFLFIDALPGKKIVLKGNHDYWWNTATKMRRFFADNGITTIDILFNNCFFYGDYAICGTRGWFYEEDQQAHDEKVLNREVMRLETSLAAAGEKDILCFLHYCHQSAFFGLTLIDNLKQLLFLLGGTIEGKGFFLIHNNPPRIVKILTKTAAVYKTAYFQLLTL